MERNILYVAERGGGPHFLLEDLASELPECKFTPVYEGGEAKKQINSGEYTGVFFRGLVLPMNEPLGSVYKNFLDVYKTAKQRGLKTIILPITLYPVSIRQEIEAIGTPDAFPPTFGFDIKELLTSVRKVFGES